MAEQTTPTKERILRAAAVIFGKNGFKKTTIRMIAKTAKVNIAAINYYFQGEEGLYAAVLEDVFHTGFIRSPATLGIGAGAEPEQQLQAFTSGMFYRLQSREGWGGHVRPWATDCQGTARSKPRLRKRSRQIYQTSQRPFTQHRCRHNADQSGPEKRMLCVISIIGQCIYYALGSSVIRKISAESVPTEDNLDQLANSIWLFSLGGIARIKEELLLPSKAEI